MKSLNFSLCGTAFLLSGVLAAQSNPLTAARPSLPAAKSVPDLETDRPDFTESDVVVGKGVIQFESGITIERDHGGNSITTPELLVRVGLGKHVELRLGGDGYLDDNERHGRAVHGHSDTEVAAKIGIFEQGPHRPALSLIPVLSIPTGNQAFTSGGYDPTIKVALGKDAGIGFYVGGNLNFTSRSGLDGRFLQTAASVSVDHELGKKFGAFWEVFGFNRLEKGGSTAWVGDVGITRDLNRNLQLDARVGRRLTAAGPGLYWGVGFVFRQVPGFALRR